MQKRHFSNTRARFQRTRDAKIFSGWVRSFAGTTLIVTLAREVAFGEGDEFTFQVYGPGSVAMFKAVLDHCYGYEIGLSLSSQIQFVKSKEEMRLLVDGMTGSLVVEDREIEVTIVDLSARGAGVMSGEEVSKGSAIELHIDSPQGRVLCSGEVVYCAYLEFGDQFRIGMNLKPQNRVDTARWQRLLWSDVA